MGRRARSGRAAALPRILVIADEALERELETGVVGGGAAELSFAQDLETALVVAAVERPDLVVCAERSLGVPPAELRNRLTKLDLPETPILCLQSQSPSGSERPGTGILSCSADELFETVVDLLPEAKPSSPRCAVRLLASLERIGCGDSNHGPSLANLLEIGEDDLVLEAPLALQRGQRLALGFFLPADGDATAHRVALTCGVEDELDGDCLRYRARLEFIDDTSRRALRAYLHELQGKRDER